VKKTTLSALKASAAPAVLGLALISSAAFAQDAKPADENEGVIVVTGSLIKNPNLVSANPVNVTTSDTIELKQSNLAEEVLREIPGVVANIGSAVNNGNGGASYVDLRGLGSNRNIVLLDGNRITPGDLQGRVDLNNIPLALVSRVDAQTGAAVTTYGADAITGVVNFVTKKNFAGVDLTSSFQRTQKGDGNFFRTDLTVGANFGDDRGNAVLSIGYQKSDPVYQGDRDFSNFGIDSYTGTLGGSGTTVPARITSTRPLNSAGVPDTTISATTSGNGGTRQVNSSGQAVSTFHFFNFNPYNIFQTPFKRYNVFAQANYKITDNVEVYTRALFSKNTVDTIIAPSGSFGGSVTMNLNNPYMTATLRNQFCAFNTAGIGAYTPLYSTTVCAAAATATGPSDPNYRTVTFNLSRRATEVGPRISNYSTTIFDYRVGLRGKVTDAINWDLNASYGESEKLQTIKNYTLQSRWRQAALANNTTTCITATNGCVPVNPFGADGSITPAMAAFLTANSSTKITTSLAQVRGLISGDTGFTSPGASNSVNFAVGAEYRKYHAQQAADVLAKTAGELGGAGGAAPDINGGYHVYEGYAEIIAPLVEDKPMMKSLTLEAGARYSSYKVDTVAASNNTFTYKAALSWEPVSDVKIRGNYAHAVRAPNIGELFTPQTVGLTTLATDPCAGAAPVTNATLRAVCIAQGAPAGTIGSILNPTAAQANELSGGNLTLKPEKANTWTVGVVVQPSAIPRLSVSLDYYNIKITDVIGTATSGDLIAACFSNLSATNPDCLAIRRNPVTGGLDGDPATTQGLFAPLTNLGKLATQGIDLAINYSHEIGAVKWVAAITGNYTLHQRFKANAASATGIDRDCVGYYSGNCGFTGSLQPKYQWSWRNTFSYKAFDLSILWRHISHMQQEPLDITANGPAFKGVLPAGFGSASGSNVDFGKIPSFNYFDASLRWSMNDHITLTGTIQNLLNKKPPIIGSSIGSTAFDSGNTYPSTYDALGRRFAVSAKVKF
jgi:outer membrane receptor protein involved in Fe transport